MYSVSRISCIKCNISDSKAIGLNHHHQQHSSFSLPLHIKTYTIIMHFTALTVLTAASAALATPVERAKTLTVPLKHQVNAVPASKLVAAGKARLDKVNGVKPFGNVDASSGPAQNQDVSYIAAVTIGSKAWNLIVDTGCKLTRFAFSPIPGFNKGDLLMLTMK